MPIYGIPQTFVSDMSDSETEPSISQISYDSEFEYECGFLNEPIHFTKKNHVSHKTINSTNKINDNSNIYHNDHDVKHETYAGCDHDVTEQNINFNIGNHCKKNKRKDKSSVDSRYHNNNKNVQKFNLVYTKFDANTINTDIDTKYHQLTEKQSTSCKL